MSRKIGPFPGFSGHRDFAQAVIDHPAFSQSDYPISDVGVRALVRLAYYSSQLPEEGAYPSFRIIVRKPLEFYELIAFDKQLKTPEDVRRLAPACRSDDRALLVVEEGGELRARGFVDVSSMGRGSLPRRPEIVDHSHGGLHLKVRGPAHLVGGYDFPLLELRGGKLRVIRRFDSVPAVRDFLDEFGASLYERVLEKHDQASARFAGGEHGLRTLVGTIVASLARRMVEGGRGGAMAIVPTEHENPPVQFKYPAALDVGNCVLDLWLSSLEAHKLNDVRARDGAARRVEPARERLRTAIDAFAGATCVDGCVAINRQMQMLGFGGEIQVSESEICEFLVRESGSRDAAPYSQVRNSIGGTRHRSAARLCLADTRVIAIVVSQDGDLTVFSAEASGDHPPTLQIARGLSAGFDLRNVV